MRSIGQGNRLGTAIYADTSDPHRLSVGLIGGDIPIFPPFAFLLSIGMALMMWSITRKRYRIVPSHSLYMRGATMAVGVALAMGLANAVEVELIRVGTIANFANVAKIATQGPFAYTRNGMYLTAFPFLSSLSIGLDTVWFVAVSLPVMMVYLDRFVVPAEERFLTNELGEEYLQYCEQVPRWLFFAPW